MIFLIILPYSKNYLIKSENDKIKQLVNSELQILKSLNDDIESGDISVEEAKNLAIELIREQRHGRSREFYFWIIDMRPVLIMHPYRPELENQYVGDYEDPDGNRLFQEMVDIVNATGGGYLEYKWQLLDDPTNITAKKSYVEGFQPWGWIIGTGFYKKSTVAEINRLFMLIIVISIIVMMIILIVSAFIMKQRFEIRRKNKYFEKSLMESEKRYKILIDSMNEGFIVQGQDGKILLVNDQICLMLGYREEELLGIKTEELISQNSREVFADNIKKRQNGIDTPYEIKLKNTDGTEVPVIVSPRGMFSESGEYQGSFATITNISALKKIEMELSKSLDEKDILIREIHHRVKNNLQILISLLNMQSSNFHKPMLLKIVKDFEARVYSMALVHEILYESENFKYIKLDEYIKRLLSDQITAREIQSKQLQLDIQVEDFTAPIDKAINYGLIVNELFTNSLTHAFKNKKADKKINISINENPDSTIIIYSDNGIGITAEAIKSENKHIGLKLINILIEQMNGTEEITSSTESGSRFEIHIPA